MIGNLILNNIFSSPATVRQFGQFYYWAEGTPFWLQAAHGIILGLVIIFVSINFFIEGARTEEKVVRYRAFLIGSGMVLF